MPRIDFMSKAELKDLLVRCWMTHDAMWFATALREAGIEATNRINLGAIRSLAPIETRRLLKTFGMEKVDNLDQLRAFLDGAVELMTGEFMDFRREWQPDGGLRVETRKCFAHEGISKLGAIEGYECGIFERIFAWLDALGIGYSVAPEDKRCMMHFEGKCRRDFRFRLGAS